MKRARGKPASQGARSSRQGSTQQSAKARRPARSPAPTRKQSPAAAPFPQSLREDVAALLRAHATELERARFPGLPGTPDHGPMLPGMELLHQVFQDGRTYLLLRADPDALDRLTPRQKEIVTLVMQGLGDKEIAARLNVGQPQPASRLSMKTVRNHLTAIYHALGIHSRIELALLGVLLLRPPPLPPRGGSKRPGTGR